MKYVNALVTLMFTIIANSTHADGSNKPIIIIELFTSQGCYACPAADKILSTLANQEDILAFGLHVDYWDYLGWKDTFAVAKFGERQAKYNMHITNRARHVTPQMVFNGVAEVAGGVGEAKLLINENLNNMRKNKELVSIEIKRNKKIVNLMLVSSLKNLGFLDINLIKYFPRKTVQIKRGENSGKTIEYINVVKSLKTVAGWDSRNLGEIEFELPTDGQYAVIIQGKNYGPIYIARKIPKFLN